MMESFRNTRVLVIGDVMLDRYVWGEVSRVSPEAPVPVVLARKKTTVLGGAGNVANNLASLGCSVYLVGLCGEDASGRELVETVRRHGIGDGVFEAPGRPTITKQRIMAQNQQLLRLDEEVREPISPELERKLLDCIDAQVKISHVLVLSDYGKGMLTDGLCQATIKMARKAKIPVLVDPKGTGWDKYRGASCITPNTKEFVAHAETGAGSDAVLAREVERVRATLGLDRLLVTRGPDGVMLVGEEGGPVCIASRAKEVFDVSGAGDTVIATLAAAIGSGRPWVEAARMANTAAGIVVGKLGTQPVFFDELVSALGVVGEGQNPKICSLEQAQLRVRQWQEMGQKVVFANGCFDLLHAGHVNLLHAAAREGNRLVVALNSDESVRRLKGPTRPILHEADRANILAALECVDLVVIFQEDTPLRFIQALRPDVLVKGADYRREQVVGHELVEGWGGRVTLIPLTKGKSTTGVVERILQADAGG